MSNKIKKGDQVRFLNTTGGGEVVGFRPGNIILVKDESGFEMPTYANEVVVVTPGSTIAPKPMVGKPREEPEEVHAEMVIPKGAPDSIPQSDRERPTQKEGEDLDIVIAYLPDNVNQLGTTPYEAYIVNDSNYDLFLIYSLQDVDTGKRRVVYSGLIEFDSVEFIERFTPEDLPERRRVACQIIPFKTDVEYDGKPGIDAVIKLEPQRFFKKHAFAENPFFDEGAITFALMEKDETPPQLIIDPESLRKDMLSKVKNDAGVGKRRRQRINKREKDAPVEVDLHEHEVLDTSAGMSPKDILDYQLKVVRDTMEKYKKQGGKKIVFIHGKGEGVLRNEVYKLIRKEYPACELQDASFQEYGFGATMVVVHLPKGQKRGK